MVAMPHKRYRAYFTDVKKTAAWRFRCGGLCSRDSVAGSAPQSLQNCLASARIDTERAAISNWARASNSQPSCERWAPSPDEPPQLSLSWAIVARNARSTCCCPWGNLTAPETLFRAAINLQPDPSPAIKAFATPNGEHREMPGRWR